MYLNNEKKFVAVLNGKMEIPTLLNALGHASIGLISKIDTCEFLNYNDHDKSGIRRISKYPFIILKAKNSNQLRTLRNSVISHPELIENDFVQTMIGSSSEDQLSKTSNTKNIDLNYICVCLYGESEAIDNYTKKFSLFK